MKIKSWHITSIRVPGLNCDIIFGVFLLPTLLTLLPDLKGADTVLTVSRTQRADSLNIIDLSPW